MRSKILNASVPRMVRDWFCKPAREIVLWVRFPPLAPYSSSPYLIFGVKMPTINISEKQLIALNYMNNEYNLMVNEDDDRLSEAGLKDANEALKTVGRLLNKCNGIMRREIRDSKRCDIVARKAREWIKQQNKERRRLNRIIAKHGIKFVFKNL